MKIITVDDSATIADHIKPLLESIDFVNYLGHAFTLNKADEIIKAQSPDVVLLDIMLKDESGIELLADINAHYPFIDVIILTNHSDHFYRNKCMELGALYFLDKSYEFDKLPQILSKLNKT